MKCKQLFTIALACMMATVNCNLTAFAQDDTGDELVHLTFDDESVKDSSGKGNDGTIAGDIAFTDGIHGKAAHIVNENGNKSEVVSQYINLGNSENIHIGTSDFTVAFWYRGLKGTENGGAILSDKNYNSGGNNGFAIGSFTNEVRANFANGSARKDIKFTGLDNGAWHHSAVTFDRDGNMTAYIDGQISNSVDISAFAGVDIGATDLVIGADTNKQNGLLDSIIDEVHIYKSVKDAAFINDLFNEYQPSTGEDPDPSDSFEEVLYVNFDGNTQDQSTKGNHGTAVGNPAYSKGVLNQALHIVNDNGSTSAVAKQYVTFGQPADLQFGSSNFSISYWYKSDNGVSNGGAFISNKNFDSGGNVGFNIGNFNNGFRFNFTPAQSSRFDAYDIAPIDGIWHHVAINVDRDGSMVTYLDGVKRKETTISASKGSIDDGSFVVGADGYFKNGLNDAFIDELHAYRGLQAESDIIETYHKEALRLAYSEANAFYEEEHTNTLYDQALMNQLRDAITDAKAALDSQTYDQAEALMTSLNQALKAVQENSTQVVSGQMLYVSFDDETANDASGRGNHGTIQGDIAFAEGIKGKAAHIVNTNGSTMSTAQQYINFNQPKDLKFDTGDFAVSFWYKTSNGGGAEAAIISNKDWSTGSNLGFTIGNFNTSSRINFTAEQGKRIDIYNLKLNDDKWHHVVMNVDRDNLLSAYIDGVLFDSKDISAYYNKSIDAEDFVIGADGLKTQGVNDAYIDEVKVFKRLMSAEEIDKEYLPVKLTMLIEKGEAAVVEAENNQYPQSKIDTFKKVIQAVKAEQPTASSQQIYQLIERMENAQDYFMVEEDAQFTFHVFSDVHITDNDRTSENSANLINGLQDLVDLSPNTKALVVPGDITNGGSDDQYLGFFDIIDHFTPNNVPPIIALGNHDVRWLCSSDNRNEAGLTIPTCKEGTSPFKERYLSGNQKYMGDVPEGQLYFDTWVDGYHFITLNTEKDLKDQAYLSPEQLTWLEQTLAENADVNKPIFVQIHQTFKGTADHEELDWVGEQEEALKAILSKYPQSVIFTGHVHNGLDLVNVYHGSWGHLVDVPCYWYKSYGSVDSQGVAYQVEVNDTKVKIRVRDFINNVWLDQYEMNFDITDPVPTDPSDASNDLSPNDMSVSAGSVHTGDEAENVLDNDEATIWHSEWSGSTVEQNYLLFDLKGEKAINGLRYLPRQNSNNGTITKYRIQVSANGTDFTTVAEGDWEANKNWKIAEFEPVAAAYVKLIVLDAPNANGSDKIASAAEVRITKPTEIDKDALLKELNDAQAILKQTDVYTKKSLLLYENEVTKAQAVYDNQLASETDIADAMKALQAAKALLVELSDLSVLNQAIQKAEALSKSDYTDESWAQLALSLANAKKLSAEDAQDDIDTAAESLLKAIEALKKNDIVEADKTLLNQLIQSAKDLKEADYLSSYWNEFKQALDQAESINETENVTQEQVDTAYNALNVAIELLKEHKKPTDPTQEEYVDELINTDETIIIKGKFPLHTELHVDEMNPQAMGQLVKNPNLLDNIQIEKLYDIYMLRNETLYQPEGTIEINIVLEKELQNKALKVLFISDNGETIEIPCTIKNNVLIFETTHNSYYAIVSEKSISKPDEPNEKPTIKPTNPIVPNDKLVLKPNEPVKQHPIKNTASDAEADLLMLYLCIGVMVVGAYLRNKQKHNLES